MYCKKSPTTESSRKATIVEHSLCGGCFALPFFQYLQYRELMACTYGIDMCYDPDITGGFD